MTIEQMIQKLEAHIQSKEWKALKAAAWKNK